MDTIIKLLGGLVGLFIILMVIGALTTPEPSINPTTTNNTSQTSDSTGTPTNTTTAQPVTLTVTNGKYNNITRFADNQNIDDSTWQTDICPKCGYKDTESTQEINSAGGIVVQKCPECGYTFYRDANPLYNPYYYQGFYDKEMGDYYTRK